MAGWDGGSVYALPGAGRPVGLGGAGAGASGGGGAEEEVTHLTRDQAQKAARAFIVGFTRGGIAIYREHLLHNARAGRFFLEIDLEDLKNDKEALHDAVIREPNEYIAAIEKGAADVVLAALPELRRGFGVSAGAGLVGGAGAAGLGGLGGGGGGGSGGGGGGGGSSSGEDLRVQVLFLGDLIETPIRAITAAHVNSLLRVPGIVTSASRTRPKASVVKLRCKKCNSERIIACPNGLSSRMLPRVCEGQKANVSDNAGNAPPGVGAGPDARCPMDPFVVVADECKYVDQQTLRLQEPPEDVPTGEMPRHVKLVVERALADKIAPGTRVAVLAVAAVAAESGGPRGRGGGEDAGGGGVGVRVPYLRVVGVVLREMGSGRASMTFTPEEEERLVSLSKQPNIYETMAASVAPSLRGDYTEDIKRAILCLLMSGSRRLLQDGARLRGDINVLLLGDPSTAKSQFLKFVERVAPVGVYTSGKGSSAAGLTASVIRSLNGEFHLEGGAMVLADGGVVCIDEFDKMREEDRVAIHEAMEQQTISVAKAGITTILNSRCSVLAAANPVFGRYDDTRSAADNIDLLPTILSRFDLIFIVRDLRDEKRDIATARHVVRLHVEAGGAGGGSADGAAGGGGAPPGGADGAGAGGAGGGLGEPGTDVDIVTMKKFISYARNKCAPTLTAGGAAMLANKYAEIRHQHMQREAEARTDSGGAGNPSVIPITVRQLEALIRITESVAKCSLSVDATEAHVDEAIRMFNVSTLSAAQSGMGGGEVLAAPLQEKVKRAEVRILKLVPPGSSMPTSRVKEALARAGYDDSTVNNALKIMERREEVALLNERKTVRRLK